MQNRKELFNKEWFLKDPRVRKWIVQCAACGQYGRKPEAPKNVPKCKFRDNFPVMELNEIGVCKDCQKFINIGSKKSLNRQYMLRFATVFNKSNTTC